MPENWKHKTNSKIKATVVGQCDLRITCAFKTNGIIYTDNKGRTTVRTLENFKDLFEPI